LFSPSFLPAFRFDSLGESPASVRRKREIVWMWTCIGTSLLGWYGGKVCMSWRERADMLLDAGHRFDDDDDNDDVTQWQFKSL